MASSLLLFDQPKTLSDLLTEHQAKQSQLNRVLVQELAELAPLLSMAKPLVVDPPSWLFTATGLVRQYGLAAAAIGGAAYLAYRYLLVPNGYKFTLPTPKQLEQQQVERSLGWATRNVGPDAAPETLPAALTQVQGAAQRLVTNTGRRALVDAVQSDPEAIGWRRIPSSPDACAFCRMMTIRGAVYKSEQTAGHSADQDFVGHGRFKFHDHCECTAIPVFRGLSTRAQVPAHVEMLISDWDTTYRDVTGPYDGAEKLNAFRRAVENDA